MRTKALEKKHPKQDLLRRWANRRGDRASLGDLAPAHGLNPAHGLEKAGQHRRLDQICDILTVLATHQSQQSAHCFLPGWMGPERYALLAACDYTLLPSRHRGNGSGSSSAIRISRCSTIGISSTLLGGLDHLGPARPLWSFVTRGIQPHWINVRWSLVVWCKWKRCVPQQNSHSFRGVEFVSSVHLLDVDHLLREDASVRHTSSRIRGLGTLPIVAPTGGLKDTVEDWI